MNQLDNIRIETFLRVLVKSQLVITSENIDYRENHVINDINKIKLRKDQQLSTIRRTYSCGICNKYSRMLDKFYNVYKYGYYRNGMGYVLCDECMTQARKIQSRRYYPGRFIIIGNKIVTPVWFWSKSFHIYNTTKFRVEMLSNTRSLCGELSSQIISTYKQELVKAYLVLNNMLINDLGGVIMRLFIRLF